MTSKQTYTNGGFTLIECMVVMLILMVTVSGILGFRHYSVRNAQQAETELLAARAAVTISEAWRAQRGADDFDPTQQGFDADFQIVSNTTMTLPGPKPSGAIPLGSYTIQVDGRQFTANLMYLNSTDVPNMRALHVVLVWQDRQKIRQQFHLSTLTQT